MTTEQEQLAPHIDDITRALDDRVSDEEIQEELEKYLEYGVALQQAKRDIVRNHGGTLDEGPRSLGSLTPDDGSVDLRVKVLTRNPKEITVDGEERTIWYGYLADETARVPYTLWEDMGLEPGGSIVVRSAYVKEAYQGDGVEVSLNEYTDIAPSDEEVDAGEHGAFESSGSGGLRTLDGLAPEDGGVDLRVKVLTWNPKEVTVQDEERTIWYGYLADETARVPYTAWDDLELEAGASVELRSAFVKEGYQGDGVEISLNEYTDVELLDEDLDVGDHGFGGGTADDPAELAVEELRAGQSNVIVTGRILDAETRTVTARDEETEIRVGTLADETGKVRFTSWEDHELEAGSVVEVSNAYVKPYRGVPNLNLGEDTDVEALDDDALPGVDVLGRDRPVTIGELERTGGATGVVVEGVVLEVREGSGLVFRCPECNRVLQKRECRVHGKVDGDPDLRIKAILDDGTGALTAILDREVTEDLMGKTLGEYEEVARDAMTHEVVRDEMVDELTARRLRVPGDVSSDDFGLMLTARDVERVEPGDVEKEAEELLYELQEAF